MKTWKIPSPKVLTAEEKPDNITTETQAKVKITKTLITYPDFSRFAGTRKVKYPVVPGMFAVGVVAEAGSGCVTVEKNTRVFLSGVTPCGTCAECEKGNTQDCLSPKIAGLDNEGYVRDFVVADESLLSPLPASVSDSEALFAGVVSLCESVIDRLNLPKGTHICVIGASMAGIILSQLLIWHQAVPILIDSDPARLESASRCGIYYTLLSDENLLSNISEITGGRMAPGSVYLSMSNQPPELPLLTTAQSGIVVYSGLEFSELSIPLKTAIDKNLTIAGAVNNYSYSAAAINLLVNKAVNFAPIMPQEREISDFKAALEEKAAQLEKKDRPSAFILNMI